MVRAFPFLNDTPETIIANSQPVHTESISSPSSIKGLEFDMIGTSLVINSNDRCIRVYAVDELAYYVKAVSACRNDGERPFRVYQSVHESTSSLRTFLKLEHRFQDLVNRTPWNVVKFSNDGEHIIGGAGHKAAHQIYIWDRANGSLAKILEGPKDSLEDLDVGRSYACLQRFSLFRQCHPIRPVIASASDQGLLHIWITDIAERWSAYAPGFEELEENLEYQEREDEFDIEDEGEVQKRKLNKQEVQIDIVRVERPRGAIPVLLSAGQPGREELEEYLDSSRSWADEECDEDDREDFAPPLDVDLQEYDEVEIRQAAVDSGTGGSRSRG